MFFGLLLFLALGMKEMKLSATLFTLKKINVPNWSHDGSPLPDASRVYDLLLHFFSSTACYFNFELFSYSTPVSFFFFDFFALRSKLDKTLSKATLVHGISICLG